MTKLRLLVTSPDGVERVYELGEGKAGQDATVGRDAEVDLPVPDRTLSRAHCRFYRGADGWRLTDLGSRNGTFLQGRPILDERVVTGDRIEIGETRVAVVLLGEGEEAQPDLQAMTTRAMAPDVLTATAQPRVDRQRENRALRHLMELNERLHAMENEDRLLEGILDAAIELTRAGRGFLLLRSDDHFEVRHARLAHKRSLADPEGSFSVSVAASVIRDGKSVLSEDARADARFDEHASVVGLKLRSLVCVPLRGDEGVVGAIYLDDTHEEGRFDGWDVRVLESFASLAAIAMRNARNRKEMAKRRREAVRQKRSIERLNERLKKALRVRTNALRRARADLAKQADELGLRYTYEHVVGCSKAIQDVLRLVDRVTDLDISVLIQGESGTGKELLARAIHFNGPRRRQRLVAESCAAIPASLMESEFFGYVKGAFTGAVRDQAGLFEQAHESTLFLDEVGEMPLQLQTKLLRVLEEREIRRVGSDRTRKVDVRLVGATNRDMQAHLASGAFREDLYYRIAGVVIDVPPLRERREDIPLLVAHFVKEEGGEAAKDLRVEAAAMELLVSYEWPGNVRELRNEVRRLLAVGRRDVVAPEHLSPRLREYRPPDPKVITRGGLKAMVEDLERRVLRAALLRHDWNKSRAAAELGLSRLGLRKKIERYGMDVEQPPAG